MVKTGDNKNNLFAMVKAQLVKFESFQLNDLAPGSQMSSFDSKYLFSSLLIPCVLMETMAFYRILEVNNNRLMGSTTNLMVTCNLFKYG